MLMFMKEGLWAPCRDTAGEITAALQHWCFCMALRVVGRCAISPLTIKFCKLSFMNAAFFFGICITVRNKSLELLFAAI